MGLQQLFSEWKPRTLVEIISKFHIYLFPYLLHVAESFLRNKPVLI